MSIPNDVNSQLKDSSALAITGINSLPAKSLAKILAHLSTEDQLACRRVCKSWNQVIPSVLAKTEQIRAPITISWRFLNTCCADRRRLAYLLSLCPQLKVLYIGLRTLSRTPPADASSLLVTMLTDQCQNLKVLHVGDRGHFTSLYGIAALTLPHLEELKLESVQICDEGLHGVFSGCPLLRVLHVKRNKEATGFAFHHAPPRLQEIDVTGCKNVNSDLFKHLSSCCQQSLKNLGAFYNQNIITTLRSKGGLETVAQFPNLESLALRGEQNSTRRCTGGVLSSLKGMGNLKRLSLSGRDMCIHDADIVHIVNGCPGLISLDISEAGYGRCRSHLTPHGLSALRRLIELEQLSISSIEQVNAEVLEALGSLTKLHTLYLRGSGSELSADALRHLLAITETTLTHLDLSKVKLCKEYHADVVCKLLTEFCEVERSEPLFMKLYDSDLEANYCASMDASERKRFETQHRKNVELFYTP